MTGLCASSYRTGGLKLGTQLHNTHSFRFASICYKCHCTLLVNGLRRVKPWGEARRAILRPPTLHGGHKQPAESRALIYGRHQRTHCFHATHNRKEKRAARRPRRRRKQSQAEPPCAEREKERGEDEKYRMRERERQMGKMRAGACPATLPCRSHRL
jgi:hypothetical protein